MERSKHARAGIVLFCLGTVGAGVAQAQGAMPDDEAEASSAWHWEVTPFVGYRMGGDFDLTGSTSTGKVDLDDRGSFGLAVSLFADKHESYELFYSRQAASVAKNSPFAPFDLNVEYLHLGGTLLLNDELPISPYLVGGLGLTRFSPQTGNSGDDSHFSMSLGGGLKLPVTKRFGVRLEARGFVTFVSNDSAFFCVSDTQGASCAVKVKSNAFIQYELLAGAAFAF